MANGRSYTTTFKADTSGFKKGTDEMIAKLTEYNKALVDNQYRQKDCSRAISQAQSELKKLQKELGDTKPNEEQQKQMKKLNDTIEEQKLKLSELKTKQLSIKQCISEVSKEVANNNSQWTTLKGTIANLTADGLEKLGSKLLEIGNDVIRTGEQFTASMSEVGAISGASAEQLRELEQAARDYGATTRFSATEAADALKYMALAGWDSQQAIAGLPAVLDLAAASGMDLGCASDIVTDYITAFGMSAEDSAKFVDIMTYAMSNSNTTTEMLGQAYKNCAATAASMGFSVEDTTAALMTMANAGVKGGEAGTTLNTIMTRLATNTKDCASQLKAYGVEIYDESGKMNSLSTIMTGLTKAFGTLNQEQQANLSKVIAGTNQYAGFQTLMQGMSDKAKQAGMSFDDYTEALERCDGAAADMAKTMNNNLGGDIKTMQSALDELKLKIYEDAEQPIRNMVKFITTYGVGAMESVINNLDKILPVLITCVSTLGALKAALAIKELISGLTSATVAQTAATEGATVAQEGLNLAMDANPIGAVCAAIGLLTGALSLYAVNVGNAADSTSQLNTEQKSYLDTLNETDERVEKSIETARSEGEKVRELADAYDELRTKNNLTSAEKERLKTISEDLAKTLGISTDELRDKTGAYKDLTKSVDEYIKSIEQQAVYEGAKEQLAEAARTAEQVNAEYEKSVEAYEEQVKKVETLQAELEKGNPYNESESRFTKWAEEQGRLLDSEEESLKRLKDTMNDLFVQREIANGKLDKSRERLRSYKGTVDENVESTNALIDSNNSLLYSMTSVEDAFTAVQTSGELLNKTQKNINDTQKISIGTLNDIVNKYPQLTDLVNDYISGVKTEKDVIESLRAVYENDVNNYNSAIRAKKLTEDGFISEIARNNVNLINELKNKYGIDVSNYANAADAKLAIEKKLKEEMERTWDEYSEFVNGKKFTEGNLNGTSYVAYNDPNGGWRQLDPNNAADAVILRGYYQDKQKLWNNRKNALVNSERIMQDFAKSIYNGTSTDSLLKLFDSGTTSGRSSNGKSTSTSSGGKSSANTPQWEWEAYGTYATGRTAAESVINLINRARNLGTITQAQEIAVIERALTRSDNSKDDIYNLKYALKQARERSTKTSGTGDTAEQTRKAALDRELKEIDYKRNMDRISEKEEIAAYDRILRTFKLTAEEKQNIEVKRYNLQKRLREQNLADEKAAAQKSAELQEHRLKLAAAAYEKYINERIAERQKDAQDAQNKYNAEIARLDEMLQRRKNQQADQDRKEQLKFIDERLRYDGHNLDSITRAELEQKRQELLNEQENQRWERSIERQKKTAQASADAVKTAADEAVEGLKSALSELTDYIARLTGTQSYSQIVNSNNRSQNISIIKNALESDDQLMNRLMRMLYDE